MSRTVGLPSTHALFEFLRHTWELPIRLQRRRTSTEQKQAKANGPPCKQDSRARSHLRSTHRHTPPCAPHAATLTTKRAKRHLPKEMK
ncbi:uncharacterized protein BKA78DRAFT_318585 [Phyllosticta capitalensis]|uniref:uncharacterized protein n=1 Tax=Phyllosticta capitalensis TaxID=121624 RepID=UPI00312EB19B